MQHEMVLALKTLFERFCGPRVKLFRYDVIIMGGER